MNPEVPSLPEISPPTPSPETGPQSAQNAEAPLASSEAGISPEGPVTHESNIKGLEAKLEGGKKVLKENWAKEQAELQKVDKAQIEEAYKSIEESFKSESGGENNAEEIKSFLERPATDANIEELKERLKEGKQKLKDSPQPPPPVEEKYRTERVGGAKQEEQETNTEEQRERFGQEPKAEGKEDDRDYYETLGVTKNASKQEIKDAYLRRAKETHPDAGNNPEEFKRVNEAFERLSRKNEQKEQAHRRTEAPNYRTEAPKQQSPFFYERGAAEEEEKSLSGIYIAIDRARADYRSRTANARTEYFHETMYAREEYNHGKFWRTITLSDGEAKASYEERIRAAEATYKQERRDAEEDRDKKLGELFGQAEKHKRPRKKTGTIHDLW